MPTQLQFRRGTTAQNNSFTGAAGEISVDTTIDTLRLHDGATAGGFEMVTLGATQTLTNKTLTAPNLTSPTIGGVAIAEYISDTVGAMVTSNTESGISVTYQDADNTLDFDVGDFSITLTGDVTGSGTVTNLGNVSFATTIAANSVALGTDTTGNYVATGATSGNGISGSVSSEGGTFTVTSNATNANTGSTIVFRDGSGNFSAGTITAALSGNATTATTLQTARTINGVSFNGSSNITVESYIENDDSTNANRYITFVDNSTAAYKRLNEDANFYYNPSTNTVYAGVFSGLATSARYADLAERYTSDSNYEAGTVLVFGGDEEVTESTQRLDKRIAGIVSTDPAYLMNSALENSVAVGLMGRVPCKVVGEINKGDMMVSSATPGHAEAWTEEGSPPAGSIIGKSLENKTGTGEGVVEVVVGRI